MYIFIMRKHIFQLNEISHGQIIKRWQSQNSDFTALKSDAVSSHIMYQTWNNEAMLQ